MSKSKLSAVTRKKLMLFSTATISTALFKVGLKNQFLQDVHPVGQSDANMIGQA